MAIHKRRAYTVAVRPMSGTIDQLSVPSDPSGINLVHIATNACFGAIQVTRRDERSAEMKPTNFVPEGGPPGDVLQLREHLLFAPVVQETEDRVFCRNPATGHTLTYELADDGFDIWLEGDLPFANQVAIELDVPFMDLRQSDRAEYQYTAKCPYRSEDRSLCYVYLGRVVPPGLLLASLTPAAGWRLQYNGQRSLLNGPDHAIQGLQMVARFDDAIDPEARPGPIRFGIRVAFPRDLQEARRIISEGIGVPLVSAPTLSGETGAELPFEVHGPALGAELLTPSGKRRPLSLTSLRVGGQAGVVRLDEAGFYVLRSWNAEGRGGDAVLQCGAPALDVLRRSIETLEPNFFWGMAEYQFWAQTFCLARRWLGPDSRRDDLIYDALVRIGMQGTPFDGLPKPPDKPTALVASFEKADDGSFLFAPIPVAHEFQGKRFSPFHLHRWERVQDGFEWIRTHLHAARAYGNDAFYEHAIRVAEAHVTDNVDEQGRVYCLHGSAYEVCDYTTVIAPLQALIELILEMRARADKRVARFESTAERIADYLVRRGLEFPTEGAAPHLHWTEDGSISCTALSLLFAWHFLVPKPEYLDMATRVLAYHEPWRVDVPDARMLDSSFRYWETKWENDGEGRSLNSGHAWTLWQAESLYHVALATGDARCLVQSYNGYRTNLCKYMPDGTAYSCFTPDYLPDRPRRMGLTHSYPQTRDRSLAYYVWPRMALTWMRTCAIVDAEAVGFDPTLGPVALNARLTRIGQDEWDIEPLAPFLDRIFVRSQRIRKGRLRTSAPVRFLFAPAGFKITVGTCELKAPEGPGGSGGWHVAPREGRIEWIIA